MNQYPTVFVSFKPIDGLTFADAYAQLVTVISELYKNHLYLMDSEKVNSYDKNFFDQVAAETASHNNIKNSLLILSKMLESHTKKTVILLIDEYDVPLAKASEKNYYPQLLDMMKSSEDNVWSLLYLTGYLTRVLPDKMEKGDNLGKGQIALKFDTISYHDYSESFYHAFLTGLFSGTEYVVESNYENGLGRSDLVIKDRTYRRAVVIEAKIAKDGEMLAAVCEEALSQIEKRQYAQKTERAGYSSIVRLGISFYKKSCMAKSG